MQPADVEFAGVSFERYFQLVFAVYAVAQASVKSWTSIVDIAHVATSLRFSRQEARTFVDHMVSLPGNTAKVFGGLSAVDRFAQRINDLSWCFDLRAARSQPLLKLRDGRVLVKDLQLLVENVSVGLRWHLLNSLPSSAHNAFSTFWGKLFEEYVQLLIAQYLPATSARSIKYEHGELDAIAQFGDDRIVVFEVKAGYLADTAKLARDEQSIHANLRKRYVRNKKDQGKGVVQLARAVSALYDDLIPGLTRPRCVYPILVVEDPSMQSLAVNAVLDEEYRKHVTVDDAMPLTLVTIDELDVILRSLAAGGLDWEDVFQAHTVNNRAAAISVSATLHELAEARKLPIPRDTFLEETGHALTYMLSRVTESA